MSHLFLPRKDWQYDHDRHQANTRVLEDFLSRFGDRVRFGTGTPEGVVVANVGSMFLRDDGGAATTLYIKESGSGNTGWISK